MARRKNDAPLTDFDFTNIEVTDSPGLPERAPREEKVNPLLSAVENSLTRQVPRQLPPIPEASVKDAQNYLRRAAQKLECGLEIRPQDAGNGMVILHFEAKADKRARQYTVADVREWAQRTGYSNEELFPRIAGHVSDAYRAEHGYKVNKR